MDKKNLELAALLHDIGKFYYQAKGNLKGNFSTVDEEKYGRKDAHAKLSSEVLKQYWEDDVVDLALYHHNYDASKNPKLTNMIEKADFHSSTERISYDEANTSSLCPLISIFSEIQIEDNKPIEDKYVPLEKIDLNKDSFRNLVPTDEIQEADLESKYEKLWDEFSKELEKYKSNQDSKSLKQNDFNTMLALLQKYTSTIPSDTLVSVPDISLYDHSKTTAALATCRYLFDRDSEENLTDMDDQKVYLTINGDISGIQKFIFKISSPQEAQSGMSKRLRGRSLYLTLLTNAIADNIVRELELTDANILFCGGGRFTIIAPNTSKAKKKLENIKKKINLEFIKKYNAELYLAIATVETCAIKNDKNNQNEYELRDFGKLMNHLTNILTEDKKCKFSDHLDEVFKIENEVKYNDTCSVCGNLYDKQDENDFTCLTCKEHEALGQKVANSNYMIKCQLNDDYDYNLAKKDFLFYDEDLSVGYVFTQAYNSETIKKVIDKLDKFVDDFRIVKLNDTDFLEFSNDFTNEKISFSFSFLGNTVPKYPKRAPLYFEHLAQISNGSNKLGVLKMDVDNLGLIFSKGLDELAYEKNETGLSISRMSTLSTQLDLFFSGFVNLIASNYKVYSSIDNLSEESKKKFKHIDLKLQTKNSLNSDKPDFIRVFKLKSNYELDVEEENILAKYEIPTIHINYSGGDDLLVLGPYDDIISFAKEIRSKFKDWTCNNSSINLSGGITIVSPKFPIGKAVFMAEEYLDASKSCGKDKISLFGEVIDWDSKGTHYKGFDELYDYANDLEEYVSGKKISKGFIYYMLKLWRTTFNESSDIVSDHDEWKRINNIRINKKSFMPYYLYKLRLVKDKTVRQALEENRNFIPWIKFPVSWVSLRMRE